MDSDDVLEIRVIGLYGRTSYKAKAAVRDKKKIKDILGVLSAKFNIDSDGSWSGGDWFR